MRLRMGTMRTTPSKGLSSPHVPLLMKQLLIFLATSFTLLAADPVKFEGEITGVVCGACKDHVTSALMKVTGVKSVEIAPTNKPEIRHIIITAAKPEFSASDANKALAAEHGDNYKITRLAKN